MHVDNDQIDDTEAGDDGLTAAERTELAADTESAGAPVGQQDRLPEAAAGADTRDAGSGNDDSRNDALNQLAASQAATAASLASVAERLAPVAAAAVAAVDAGGDDAGDDGAAAAAAAAAPQEPDWDAERKALRARFDDNELDDEDYETERERLIERKAEWKATATANQVMEQRLQEQANERARVAKAESDAAWDTSLSDFMKAGTNAAMLADKRHMAVFNQSLEDLAKEKPTATFPELLREAGNATREAFKLPTEGTTRQQMIDKATEARRNGAAPPDLSRAPAAGAGDDSGGGEFAHMDAMDVDSMENELAHWDEAKVARFLESAPGGLQDNPRG